MEKLRWLDDGTINELVNICENELTPIKEKFNSLSKKMKLKFGYYKENNKEIFLTKIRKELYDKKYNGKMSVSYTKKIDELEVFLYDAKGNKIPEGVRGFEFYNFYIMPYIEEYYKKEWQLIISFDYNHFLEKEIIKRLMILKGEYSLDLMEITDYRKYWEQYSIRNINERYIKPIKIIMNLFEKTKNQILKEYDFMENSDKISLINEAIKIYSTNKNNPHVVQEFLLDYDFYEINKIENEKKAKEEFINNLHNEIVSLENQLSENNRQDKELIELKLKGLVNENEYVILRDKIKNNISELTKSLEEMKNQLKTIN